MAYRVTGAPEAIAKLQKVAEAIRSGNSDQVVNRVALKVYALLVQATPKRWFGQVRKAWQINRQGNGVVQIVNLSKIMLFLEEGTANAGTGYIYPKNKKFLYIPLNARAAAGWQAGLVRGVDYVLARRVKGIKPRWIVAKIVPLADEMLKREMEGFVASVING